ncbi:hypothetical protein ACCQ13_16485 [Xanthomonas sp. NCPPB 1638]|uniref:hypothetical protein n=1 Tax=Xanthomonas TaxID=338 RepID=UPI00132EB189|nr:hypothetical protein [Xanthomonas cucurbitae]QHG89195.1 hypothetical protein EBN15_16095 [Xanthomonas cucurbitae]WDM74800.1 hypothetical protein K6982_15725 [Xanthomonas cucurbitae]
MSGSNGNGYGGGFESTAPSCENLVINTQISSPKMQVIQGIAVGEILDVAVEPAGNVAVVVVKHQGKVAGGVASPNVQQLRECIQQGTAYQAKVTAVNGPQVSIRIKAV